MNCPVTFLKVWLLTLKHWLDVSCISFSKDIQFVCLNSYVYGGSVIRYEHSLFLSSHLFGQSVDFNLKKTQKKHWEETLKSSINWTSAEKEEEEGDKDKGHTYTSQLYLHTKLNHCHWGLHWTPFFLLKVKRRNYKVLTSSEDIPNCIWG